MRSKTANQILKETPQETKDKVRDSSNDLVLKKINMKTQKLLLEIEKHFGIGCRKICQERHEQIHKHGRTVDLDLKQNTEGQLLDASFYLLTNSVQGFANNPPKNWNQKIWSKMCNKEHLEDRIVISAALTAAHIDMLNK
jgi:hypothetical protein